MHLTLDQESEPCVERGFGVLCRPERNARVASLGRALGPQLPTTAILPLALAHAMRLPRTLHIEIMSAPKSEVTYPPIDDSTNATGRIIFDVRVILVVEPLPPLVEYRKARRGLGRSRARRQEGEMYFSPGSFIGMHWMVTLVSWAIPVPRRIVRLYREDPIGILQRRDATGELTTAEYEERKARIERDLRDPAFCSQSRGRLDLDAPA